MKVKNITGTTGMSCNCGSWIQHWRNYTNQIATICRARGCSNYANVGAHVRKCYSTDNSWYIIPFCYHHNSRPSSECIEINFGTDLVPANRNLTCR